MERLSGYTVTRKLHEGNGTVLYAATRPAHAETVVIKVVAERHSTRGLAKVEHEHAVLESLDIPGVVKTRGLLKLDHGVGLVLEYIPDPPLNLILAERRLDLRTSLEFALRCARILTALHAADIVHKDIKPHNILCNLDSLELHLIDFGIAMHTSAEMQTSVEAETYEGTLAYMSPEQTGRMNRVLDRRTDLYSLGVTVYECLAGQRPFTSEDPLTLIHSHVARMPTPPHELDAAIPELASRIVMKLLAKAAEDRYQSAAGLAADLERCLASLTGQGTIEDFELGAHDQTGELNLPQRLYGRARELSALDEAFARVREGGAELVLVTGYSGIGKSALVKEIHKPIASQRGLFAAGKFDQFNRATPYASIGPAFGGLVRLILSERSLRLEHWRARLREAFGSNGQVLIDLIPELELVVGSQPPVPTLGPTESQNRFGRVFRRFIDVLAGPEHPFVLFLDDLQWADPASLELIESLLADGGRRHFLLIGAYRDNEVDRAHPLTLTLDALREAGVEPRTLRLKPLSLADVRELLGETLDTEPGATEDLARVIHTKTNGNPFFVNQFVRELHNDGLLEFDADDRRWRYDLRAVEARAYTDNVVDLMAAKIHRLPAEVRDALSLAACIGFEFDLQTLATIDPRPADEIHRALWLAIQRGLIVALDAEHTFATDQPSPKIRYRFLHDRVQQAAYDLVELDRRAVTHLTIGRLLAAARDEADPDARLFEVTNHLNNGAALIDDPEERRELMRLNLRAGRRAKAATAYAGAADYLRRGIELHEAAISSRIWDQDYRLSFDLHHEYAECEYLCSRYEHAEALFRDLIERARDELDRADIYIIRLRLYQVAGRYKQGVSLAYEALAGLGVRFPDEPEAIAAAIGAEAAAVPKKLGDRSVASLIDAPRMTDPRDKRIMGLLAGLLPCAYIGQPEVFPLGALRMVNFSLEHGNTEESCFAYSVYGLMSVSVFGDIPLGLEFSTMSIALNERLGDAALRGTLLHLHGDHINFWSHHIRTDFPILERAFHACLEVGDLVYASYLAFETVWQAIERGDTPAEVRELAERYRVFATQTKNLPVLETIRMQAQYVAFLEGETEDDRPLDSDGYDADASLELVTAASFGCGVVFFHIIRLMILYTQGRYAEALAAAGDARPMLGAAMAMPIEATFYLYEALTLLRLPEAAAERVADHLAKLALWAKHCPENFEHKHLLVQAELARVEGRIEAGAVYDRAIESAREHDFVQYEALGNELAGRYYDDLGRRRVVPVYMNAAYVGYQRWGATGVARALLHRYPSAISIRVGTDPDFRRTELAAATLVHATSTGTLRTHEAIDLGTVLRATQVIAGEIDLTRLVGELMRLVLDNAGGVDVSLFFADHGELVLAARGTTESEALEVDAERPLDECEHVAASVVRLVARTQEVQVIGDACEDPIHGRDPHVARARVRSILCLPLMHRQQLTGVLYVESPEVKAAFNAERVALLEMLSLQAAGAMDNARLYADIQANNERLEAEVRARTEELRRQLDEQTRSDNARHELQEQIIALQRERLEELATPMIPITDDVRVLPLVGTVDGDRAQQILEAALEDAHQNGTRMLLIDLTGLRNANVESVAKTLARTARALALVGAEVVLTGIGPTIAQAFVGLGLDISGIGVHATLQDGIAAAMRRSSARAFAGDHCK